VAVVDSSRVRPLPCGCGVGASLVYPVAFSSSGRMGMRGVLWEAAPVCSSEYLFERWVSSFVGGKGITERLGW